MIPPASLVLNDAAHDPIASLPGLRPSAAVLLARAAGGTTLLDLLFHLPEIAVIDRRWRPALSEITAEGLEAGRVATLSVTVRAVLRPATARQPWRVRVDDGSGEAELVFFGPRQVRGLAPGARIVASGRLEQYAGRLRIVGPDHLRPAADAALVPSIEAVWRLTAGLRPVVVARAMRAALARLGMFDEWLDAELVRRRLWPGFVQSLRLLHFPGDAPLAEDADMALVRARARERLGYDELLANQVATLQARARNRVRPGRAISGDGSLRAQALARFGHPPTAAQCRVLAEIDADLAAPRRMMRLLQGDVGAGKTLVAVLAMLAAAEAGAQAVLMAPTEILARQHHRTLSRLSPLPAALLTGSIKGVARTRARAQLADGTIKLAVGTHALFQQGVEFADLGLAVIDEQHRFGVEQRLRLGEKGDATDILVMTATPIPRTLLLTRWGEIEVSRLDAKPAARLAIQTSLHRRQQTGLVCDGVARAVAGGAQVFWVCPLVSENAILDVAAAEARAAVLTERFGAACVGLAHGRQESAVRQAALDDFAAGRTRILVATTVIEVGVDVPAATIMVVEHAERFGLAQLHQLRGRVGRGSARSYCLLLHDDELGADARRRLRLLRDSEDGFLIADVDHRLRGGGDLMGRRQSGLPGFRLATGPNTDAALLLARRDSQLLLTRDPDLRTARGQAVSALLALFGRDAALRTLESG
ncbi:ATP-dependent DNA helicase RecG [Lichenicoccus sp.]|uniref:ATP-dependent DNA helicase RecG n=1 Tax=Lichenicoccus sp. TaxID=2781899 RepID=UPI003D0B3B7C